MLRKTESSPLKCLQVPYMCHNSIYKTTWQDRGNDKTYHWHNRGNAKTPKPGEIKNA